MTIDELIERLQAIKAEKPAFKFKVKRYSPYEKQRYQPVLSVYINSLLDVIIE